MLGGCKSVFRVRNVGYFDDLTCLFYFLKPKIYTFYILKINLSHFKLKLSRLS